MTRRRVVITGLGIISPVGNTVEQAWQNIVAGRSGIDRVTRFDVSSFPVQIAGEVKNFNVADYLPVKDARRMDTFIHYGMAAGIQAIKDAGLEAHPTNAERIGYLAVPGTQAARQRSTPGPAKHRHHCNGQAAAN